MYSLLPSYHRIVWKKCYILHVTSLIGPRAWSSPISALYVGYTLSYLTFQPQHLSRQKNGRQADAALFSVLPWMLPCLLFACDGYTSICSNHSKALAFTHFRSPNSTGASSGHFIRWSRVWHGCKESQLGELLRPKCFRVKHGLAQAVLTMIRRTQVLRSKSQPGVWGEKVSMNFRSWP